MEGLDLTALRRALAEYDRDPGNAFVRDVCIQRFGYCCAPATRMIERRLAATGSGPGAVRVMAFRDRIRLACGAGILPDSRDRWWQYRDDRAATAHGHDEDRAKAIIGNLPAFAEEVRVLPDRLTDIHGGTS